MISRRHLKTWIISLPLSVAGLYWPASALGQCSGGACPGSSAYQQAQGWLRSAGGSPVTGDGSGGAERTAFSCPGGKCGRGGGSLPAMAGAPPAPGCAGGSCGDGARAMAVGKGSSGKACGGKACGGKKADAEKSGPIRKVFRFFGRMFGAVFGFCARCRR